MSTQLKTDKVIDKTVDKLFGILDTQTVEEYVAKQFPLGEGEHQVKYCSVGENRFRINFYTKQISDTGFGTHKITRSHYVVCKETEDGWSHFIWEDEDKPSLENGDLSKYL